MIKSGLVQVLWKANPKRQPWFNKELADMKKTFNKAEKEWLLAKEEG